MDLNTNNDKASKEYWDGVWQSSKRQIVDLRNYYHYRMESIFKKFIPLYSKVLEVGCGNSKWLPYFAKYYHSEVWGIDYSKDGVELAKQNLVYQSVKGNIILGDIFTNNEIPKDYFDVVLSLGFIEHFNNAFETTELIKSFVKSQGLIITLVPNLEGWIGWLHKVIDLQVYKMHLVVDPKKLDLIHTYTGLKVVNSAEYLGVFSIGVVNFNRIRKQLPRFIDRFFWLSIQIFQQTICLPFRFTGLSPESKAFSPYIIGVYRRV